jgi:Dolichyl-phosphate-mannose-protein mannosyltransferase
MADYRTTLWNFEIKRLATRILAILFVVRLAYLLPFLAQFDLAADESYYWDWGRRLAWGYYSKPPLIGWLHGLVGRISGDSVWGVRICALLFATGSLWLLHTLAQRLFGDRAALTALVLAVFTPANAALSLFLTIDAPLVLLWTAALLVFWRALERPNRAGRWGLLCLILGLGYLSKQMMLVFPLLMICFCAFTQPARQILRLPAFWLCVGLSLLFLMPPLLWNAGHGWVTFKHTGHHFAVKDGATIVDRIVGFFTFIGLQLLIFTPVTWLMMIATAVGGLWKWKSLGTNERFAIMFSGPALLVFGALALRQDVNPNWPAVYYVSAVILAGAWVERVAMNSLRWTWLQGWKKPAMILAFVITLAAYVFPVTAKAMGLSGNKYVDAGLRLRGWRDVGKQAGELLKKVPSPAKTFFVVLGHRDHASLLAFHMPQHPRVYRFMWAGVFESQYEVWQFNDKADPGDDQFIGGDALVFVPPGEDEKDPYFLPGALGRQFKGGEKIGEIHVPVGSGEERSYEVHLLRDLKFWDPPAPPDVRRAEEATKTEADRSTAK